MTNVCGIYNNERRVKRGDIFYADLPRQDGHVQSGIRPVLIIQNDDGNKVSPTVIVVPLTTADKKPMLTHAKVKAKTLSNCLFEQPQTIDRSRLGSFITSTSESEMRKLDLTLAFSVGLGWIVDLIKGNSGGKGAVVPC